MSNFDSIMVLASITSSSQLPFPHAITLTRTQITSSVTRSSRFPSSAQTTVKAHLSSDQATAIRPQNGSSNKLKERALPTMSDILASSKAQKLDLKLHTLGPFFRITATSLETNNELGRAEGLITVWLRGKILHLDSMRLKRETLGMEKSVFGIGLFIGAVAIRHGYECGCKTAELLAINDSDLYHTKLVRFYGRIGFKAVHEVTGSRLGDLAHMLVWGGIGTRMEADVKELMLKWCTRFKQQA